MVRALKLESTPSGTYYNLSQGAFLNLSNLSAGVHVSSIVVSPAGGYARVGFCPGWRLPCLIYR